jgi:DNA-binding transcriptional regulator YiaG
MGEVTKQQIIITLFFPIINIDEIHSLPEETIGQKIYKYRKINNLYQKDIADMLDVCLDTVTGYEKERTIPSKKTLNMLEYYNII